HSPFPIPHYRIANTAARLPNGSLETSPSPESPCPSNPSAECPMSWFSKSARNRPTRAKPAGTRHEVEAREERLDLVAGGPGTPHSRLATAPPGSRTDSREPPPPRDPPAQTTPGGGSPLSWSSKPPRTPPPRAKPAGPRHEVEAREERLDLVAGASGSLWLHG